MVDSNKDFRIIVKDPHHIKRALRIITNLAGYSKQKPYEVIVRLFKRNRSREQNALYWVWLGIISKDNGDSQDDLHEYFKNKYIPRILIKTSTVLQEANAVVQDIRKSGEHKIPDLIRRLVREIVTTKNLNTDQFTEYLTCIKEEAWNSMGVLLPEPDGLKKGVDW